MSEEKQFQTAKASFVLIVVAIIAAFVLFVPVKTSTGFMGTSGYSRTTWDLIVGNR